MERTCSKCKKERTFVLERTIRKANGEPQYYVLECNVCGHKITVSADVED